MLWVSIAGQLTVILHGSFDPAIYEGLAYNPENKVLQVGSDETFIAQLIGMSLTGAIMVGAVTADVSLGAD